MKRYKWIALLGGAVGYVLGTKAGRARYEQIRRTTQKVMGDPRVRDMAHQAQEQVSHAAEKVRHHGDGSDSSGGTPTGTGMPPSQGTMTGDAMMGR